ncbi:hypothetical protein AYP1020_p21 (plasmid) [Staphylococcus capitis subsp. capitis]|uniref:hypothetical protein n=1 Tax=Staphylococcus capitis TaxID=29388 RepID=UPI000649DE88|nr:hypothetical protein [Staphylococcus capitis]AKL93476.1 hypothetical protein AYP1020_p21 [Staphylococcus capitis subsp. capitis]
MQYYSFKQNKKDLEKLYADQRMESKKYRGRTPKKKRIRNKIQKRRKEQKSPFVLDEFPLIGKDK